MALNTSNAVSNDSRRFIVYKLLIEKLERKKKRKAKIVKEIRTEPILYLPIGLLFVQLIV